MKKIVIKLIWLILIILFSGCCTLDRFDCNSRPKLIISDLQLPPAEVENEYVAELENAADLCSVVLQEGSAIPEGLKLTDLESGLFLQGIPQKAGEYVIEFIGTEYKTQCP